MKMRKNAIGDTHILINNRLYYTIKYNEELYTIFIDKNYNVGKIIDISFIINQFILINILFL